MVFPFYPHPVPHPAPERGITNEEKKKKKALITKQKQNKKKTHGERIQK